MRVTTTAVGSLAKRSTGRSALLFAVPALSIILVGCGRSAPETAAAPEQVTPLVEPESAGVRVVGQTQVIVPPPTTPTTPTTVAATTPPAAAAGGTYIIEPGDSLSVIAERFGITTEALSLANNITDPNTIRPGQELIIPAPG